MHKSAPTVLSEGDEPLDWGTDDDEATHIDKAIAKATGLEDHHPGDCYCLDDFGDPNYFRQVPNIFITDEEFNLLHKQLQILVATLDSIGSVCNNKLNNFACHSLNCVKCKENKTGEMAIVAHHKHLHLNDQISLLMRKL